MIKNAYEILYSSEWSEYFDQSEKVEIKNSNIVSQQYSSVYISHCKFKNQYSTIYLSSSIQCLLEDSCFLECQNSLSGGCLYFKGKECVQNRVSSEKTFVSYIDSDTDGVYSYVFASSDENPPGKNMILSASITESNTDNTDSSLYFRNGEIYINNINITNSKARGRCILFVDKITSKLNSSFNNFVNNNQSNLGSAEQYDGNNKHMHISSCNYLKILPLSSLSAFLDTVATIEHCNYIMINYHPRYSDFFYFEGGIATFDNCYFDKEIVTYGDVTTNNNAQTEIKINFLIHTDFVCIYEENKVKDATEEYFRDIETLMLFFCTVTYE